MPVGQTNRRTFIAALGGAAAGPVVASAQQPTKVFRIGALFAGGDYRNWPGWGDFIEALRGFGWIEGKNFVFEHRFANDRLDRLPEMAAELVRLNVDVIVTGGTLAPIAAKRATSTIPIVMQNAGDPLGSGLVTNLARPGENVTGLSLMAPDLGGKRLELLKETLPRVSHAGVLWNSANPYSANSFNETRSAAEGLRVDIQSFGVKKPDDFVGAFQAIESQNLDALITVEDPLTFGQAQPIVDFATKHRLAAIYGLRGYVDVGGLMSYGASISDLLRRSAGYVDKILKGAKPGDLPVEQPTKFELIINLKAAKQIDLQIPVPIIARADEVIE
jgi:putative tryptophan/tyrosine transport system substrate-binding protein